jgi:hypothetical protein
MNHNAGRATPCAGAPLPGAELGCQMRLQLISRCSNRKDAERTKGENRQEAKHGQIFPRPRLITAQRWASSLGLPLRQQPARSPSQGYSHRHEIARAGGKRAQEVAPASKAACVDSICSLTVIGSAGFSDFCGMRGLPRETAFAPQYCLLPRTLVKPIKRDDHRKAIMKQATASLIS